MTFETGHLIDTPIDSPLTNPSKRVARDMQDFLVVRQALTNFRKLPDRKLDVHVKCSMSSRTLCTVSFDCFGESALTNIFNRYLKASKEVLKETSVICNSKIHSLYDFVAFNFYNESSRARVSKEGAPDQKPTVKTMLYDYVNLSKISDLLAEFEFSASIHADMLVWHIGGVRYAVGFGKQSTMRRVFVEYYSDFQGFDIQPGAISEKTVAQAVAVNQPAVVAEPAKPSLVTQEAVSTTRLKCVIKSA